MARMNYEFQLMDETYDKSKMARFSLRSAELTMDRTPDNFNFCKMGDVSKCEKASLAIFLPLQIQFKYLKI